MVFGEYWWFRGKIPHADLPGWYITSILELGHLPAMVLDVVIS